MKIKQLGGALKQAFVDSDTDYTSVGLSKAIFLLSVPMVLEMLLTSIFSLADMFFVSRLGNDAVATIGLTEAVINLVYSVAFGISIATTAIISRRVGERKFRAASEAALQSIWIGTAISLLIAIPGILFASDILHLMGGNQTISGDMSGYMAISLGGSFSIILIFINNAIFRSSGKPLLALRTLAVANLLNIILDPLMIFGIGSWQGMGIEGAAWATLIGRGTAVFYQLYVLSREEQLVSLRKARKYFDFDVIRSILKLSAGGISQNFAATFSWLLLVRIISSLGSVAVAGYTIALRILLFILLPVAGVANATSTLVGQNLGAKKPERAVRTVKIAGGVSAAIMFLAGVLCFIFAEQAVTLFATQAETAAAATRGLRYLAVGFPIYALGMVMMNALNGAGDTTTPFRINILCYLVIEISLALLLAYILKLNETGIYISILAAELAFTASAIYFFAKGKWKAVKV